MTGRRDDTVYTDTLIDAVAANLGEDRERVREIIREFVEAISDCLVRGDRVSVSGLGAFKAKKIKGVKRPKEIQQHEDIAKGATIRVSFSKSHVLKEVLKMADQTNNEEVGMDKYAVDETVGSHGRDLDKMAAAGCPVCGRTPERH